MFNESPYILNVFYCYQAFREAVPRLEKLATAAKPGMADASSLRELSAAWSIVSKAHDIHARHEESAIFPVLEGYFPGQVSEGGRGQKLCWKGQEGEICVYTQEPIIVLKLLRGDASGMTYNLPIE